MNFANYMTTESHYITHKKHQQLMQTALQILTPLLTKNFSSVLVRDAD